MTDIKLKWKHSCHHQCGWVGSDLCCCAKGCQFESHLGYVCSKGSLSPLPSDAHIFVVSPDSMNEIISLVEQNSIIHSSVLN